MTTPRHIAVIDIGKTNAKLALVDLKSLTELAVVTRPNTVLLGPPWPHFDVDGHWAFLLSGLTKFHEEFGIDGISVTTHGACVALLDKDGNLAAPVLDYEHEGPESLSTEYDHIRPAFEETGSPRLAGGLNIGAQLHWQFHVDPGLVERTHQIVTYPQFWSYRLTGVASTDVTSLGCHTDLWNPTKGEFSTLVETLGISKKIAPAKCSTHLLGPILPEISDATGLPADTPVVCGIHDSNASLFPHILTQESPFSVVSTGTWVIAMSVGAKPVSLDPSRDTLINVSALGQPVTSARFMGGREYELIHDRNCVDASAEDVNSVLDNRIMLLPSVDPKSGPFKGIRSHWLPDGNEAVGSERNVALSFYLALMTAECLGISGGRGDIIIEGPIGRNPQYLNMLRAATGRHIKISKSSTGTSIGAALLLGGKSTRATLDHVYLDADLQRLKMYSERWKRSVSEMKNCS